MFWLVGAVILVVFGIWFFRTTNSEKEPNSVSKKVVIDSLKSEPYLDSIEIKKNLQKSSGIKTKVAKTPTNSTKTKLSSPKTPVKPKSNKKQRLIALAKKYHPTDNFKDRQFSGTIPM